MQFSRSVVCAYIRLFSRTGTMRARTINSADRINLVYPHISALSKHRKGSFFTKNHASPHGAGLVPPIRALCILKKQL